MYVWAVEVSGRDCRWILPASPGMPDATISGNNDTVRNTLHHLPFLSVRLEGSHTT